MKMGGIIFIYFSLLPGFVATLNCTSPSRRALFDAVMREPNIATFPVRSFSHPLNVSVSLTVKGIIGVDEKAQSFTLFIWKTLRWHIEGLHWDEKECGGGHISVPRSHLWIPDITISEFMDEEKSPKTPYVYLYNTGQVLDDKPIRVVTFCGMGIYTFPFDIQNCSLTFGSYIHLAEDIKMTPGATVEEILQESKELMVAKGEWELLDIQVTSVELEILTGSYTEIEYFIILRRRPILYVVNLIVPSCFLLALDLFSFLLPPHSVDRCAFKMTLILGYTVFLLIMNDLLPVTGNSAPLLNVFFLVSFTLMVTSLLETVFITNIQVSSSQYSVVPKWLSVIILRYLAAVVCLPPKKKTNRITVDLRPPTAVMNAIIPPRAPQSNPDDQEKLPPEPTLDVLKKLSRDLMAIRLHIDKQYQENQDLEEWQMIGIVIDRLLFSFYTVLLLTTFITIAWVWTKSSSYEK